MAFGIDGQFMDPVMVVSHFHLHEGDVVADFGAGSGDYLKPLSQAVGHSGRVYACEIQKNLVESLSIRAQHERLMNISPIWCDLETVGGTKLGDGVLDAGILSNTLFQIEDKQTALREIERIIHPGGRLFIVDWSDSFGGLGPHPKDVITEISARALVESSGFIFERSFPTGDHHYGFSARRQ